MLWIAQAKASVDVNFFWKSVAIGADLDAVEFAYNNKCFLIKNRAPHHHSYEGVTEKEWAEKIYHLYGLGLVPFLDKSLNIRVFSDDKKIKIVTEKNTFVVQYEDLYVFDTEGVSGVDMPRELSCYRVVDWFDCKGLHDLDFSEINTNDDFVRKIKLFPTTRVDGEQKYMDLLCESFLSEDQLKSFDYSDTMSRFKIVDLLNKHGADKAKITLWKRDIYPIYKTI